jgi:hypothetical protein
MADLLVLTSLEEVHHNVLSPSERISCLYFKSLPQ